MFSETDRLTELRRWVEILLEIPEHLIPDFIFDQALAKACEGAFTPSLQIAVREVIYGCLTNFVLKGRVSPSSLDSATLHSLVRDLGKFLTWYFKEKDRSKLMDGIAEAVCLKLSSPLFSDCSLQELINILDRKCDPAEIGKLCSYSELFPWKSHPFGHFEKRDFYVSNNKEVVWCVIVRVGRRLGVFEFPLGNQLTAADEVYQLYKLLGSPGDSEFIPRSVPKHLLLSTFLENSDANELFSNLNIGKVGECSVSVPYDSISELLNEGYLESAWEVKMSSFVWALCQRKF